MKIIKTIFKNLLVIENKRHLDYRGEFRELIIEKKSNRMIVWPSNFLYPHAVKPVTEGIRYSIVSWAL